MALETKGAQMWRASHKYDLEDGEAKCDRIFLSDRRDGAGQLAPLDGIKRGAEELDASRARLHRAAQYLEQSGLAGAVRTHDRERLARRHLERDAMKHGHAGVSGANRTRTHRSHGSGRGHSERVLLPLRCSM